MTIKNRNNANWKKFVQINIYGRTLGELRRNGVNLNDLLNDIGCSKYWITEGSMFSGDSDSGMDSSFEETVPLFSTTVADTKYPRCSTPIPSRLKYKMSLCASKVISRISANCDDSDSANDFEDVVPVVNEVDNLSFYGRISNKKTSVVRNLLDEMVDEVRQNVTTRQPSLEHFPEVAQEVEVDEADDSEVVKDLVSSIVDQVVGEIDSSESPNSDSKLVRARKIQERRIEIFDEKNNMRRLKRTTSEVKKGGKKAMRVRKIKSVHPVLSVDNNVEESKNIAEIDRQLSVESEKVFCDLTPVSSDAEVFSERYQNWLDIESANRTVPGNLHDYLENQNPTNDYELLDGGDTGDGDDWEDAPDTFNNWGQENNTVDISPMYEEMDEFAPVVEFFDDVGGDHDSFRHPNITGASSKRKQPHSILVRKSTSQRPLTSQPKSHKKVSFAVHVGPTGQPMTAVQYKKHINEVHAIKCQFKNCKTTYRWKIKYGKLRLVDHALTHTTRLTMSCQCCDYTAKTIRQMRHHYSRLHADEKMKGYGMKDLPVDDIDVKAIWNVCYKDQTFIDQLHIIGEASTRPNHMRLRRNEMDETAGRGPFGDENGGDEEDQNSSGAEDVPQVNLSDF